MDEIDLKGFSKLSRKERFQKLTQLGLISKEDVKLLLKSNFLDKDLAEDFIENSLGYFPMPFGIVTHMNINSKDVVVPMAVEETSIIAAASKTAKWVKSSGGYIRANRISKEGLGQIQFPVLTNAETFVGIVNSNSAQWVELCNDSVSNTLFKRGGGVKNFSPRVLKREDGKLMGVVHVTVDTCEAMGANIINQVCEFMRAVIEEATAETGSLCILSNLVDTNLTKVEVVLENIEKTLGEKIEEASIFAETDPYRAATNNKGIMNAIDSVLIATGNDWRAVEAGVHSFTNKDGKYTSLSKWRYKEGKLKGEMTLPISVGTVGGVTRLHPFAQLSMKIMGTDTVDKLCEVCASVGLVQNLGALRALTTVGIIEGHMKLHIKNLTLSAGAKETEAPLVQKKLEEILKLTKRISLSQAIEALSEVRLRIKEGSSGGVKDVPSK